MNVAARYNGGSVYTGNIALDWYFFDPVTSSPTDGSQFQDFAAIAYYDTASTTADYSNPNLNVGATQIQRLSLGAPYNAATGYSSSVYQARIVRATDGYSNGSYFNTTAVRTFGWHHGRIEVGDALPDSTNDVYFYIDDTLVLTHNSMTDWGYNVIEFNTDCGPVTGYFDDVQFETDVVVTPEPVTLLLLGTAALLLPRRRRA